MIITFVFHWMFQKEKEKEMFFLGSWGPDIFAGDWRNVS